MSQFQNSTTMSAMLYITTTKIGKYVHLLNKYPPQGVGNEEIWVHYCTVPGNLIPGTQKNQVQT